MKRLVLIALIISVTAGVVFAQVDLPGTAWASPQSTATQGRIRSIADDFIRADAYTGVKFDKFFAMASYRASPVATLGFATTAGSLYIGTMYAGNFWANVPNVTYGEITGNWLDTANKSGVKSYAAMPVISGGAAPSNLFSVLIGAADMGFRFSLYTNKRMFSDSDFINAGNSYKSYEEESGGFIPQLLWSMTKNLTDNGIKPYLGVNLGLNKDYKKTNTYYQAGGVWLSDVDRVEISANSTNVGINAGLGGYTLLNKNGFRLSADLTYALSLISYDNEYNYTGADGKNKIKTGFKGTTNTTNTFTEASSSSHTINPSLSGQWSGGPLAFRFQFNTNVGLANSVSSAMGFKYVDPSAMIPVPTTDGELVKRGTDSTANTVSFSPDLRLALQWKIVPKLALNLGTRINFGALQNITTESKLYTGNGTEGNSTKTVANINGTGNKSLTVGVTFNVTDNVTLEAASGAQNGTIDVFGTSGSDSLFYFTNLLVSLKF